MLETLVAQPLLAGGQPEEVQMVTVHAPKPPSAKDPTVLTIETTDPSSNGMTYAMEVQLLPAYDRTDVGPLADEPHRTQMSTPAPAMLEPLAAYVPPLEEFPPLEKGRTLKIRDSFEVGTTHHGSGSVLPKPGSGKQASRGSATMPKEGETLAVRPEGIQDLDGSAIPSHAGQPDEILRHAETSAGIGVGIPARTGDGNTLGSACGNLAGGGVNLGDRRTARRLWRRCFEKCQTLMAHKCSCRRRSPTLDMQPSQMACRQSISPELKFRS